MYVPGYCKSKDWLYSRILYLWLSVNKAICFFLFFYIISRHKIGYCGCIRHFCGHGNDATSTKKGYTVSSILTSNFPLRSLGSKFCKEVSPYLWLPIFCYPVHPNKRSQVISARILSWFFVAYAWHLFEGHYYAVFTFICFVLHLKAFLTHPEVKNIGWFYSIQNDSLSFFMTSNITYCENLNYFEAPVGDVSFT